MNAVRSTRRRTSGPRWSWVTAALAFALAALAPGSAWSAREAVPIPGGPFVPLFGADPGTSVVQVAPFRLDVDPVSNAEFFAFILAHTEWEPGRLDPGNGDARYVSHWVASGGRIHPLPDQMQRPVTFVSWFAADAYCRSQGGTLPTVFQWEFAAAASATRRDARDDPEFIATILGWYARPFRMDDLEAIGHGTPNLYGVRDLHRLVWEWTDDFDSPRFNGAGGRGEGDPSDRSCGAGSYGAQGVQDYAAFMRFALRTSLQASYTSASLGFRCAYAAPGAAQ